MKHTALAGVLVAALFSLSACIEADDTYTLYLERDGGVQVVVHRDSVESTATSPVEREKEEKTWLKEFRSKKSDLHKRFKDSGAKRFQATISRDRRPFVATYRGHFDRPEALGAFFDLKGPDPEGKVELLSSDKHPGRRKLVFTMFKKPSPSPRPSEGPRRESDEERNVGLKFIAASGRIVAASGCRIVKDGRACLLDLVTIDRESREATGDYSFWVEWDVEASRPAPKKVTSSAGG